MRPLLLFLLLGTLLSGCLKLNATLTISPDNTITGEYIVAYVKDPEHPPTGFGLVQELAVSRGTATASRYEDSDYLGTRYRLQGVPLEDLANFIPVTYEKRQTGSIRITRDGSDFLVAGSFDFRETTPVERTPEQQQQAERLFQVRIRLTFPGAVESGNGTIDGNTISWDMRPFVLTTLQARASAIAPPVVQSAQSGLDSTLLLGIGLGALVLVVLLVVALWALRRRRRRPAREVLPVATDPTDFAWVLGDRRPARAEPQPWSGPERSPWADPGTELRYGPGLGGSGAPPAPPAPPTPPPVLSPPPPGVPPAPPPYAPPPPPPRSPYAPSAPAGPPGAAGPPAPVGPPGPAYAPEAGGPGVWYGPPTGPPSGVVPRVEPATTNGYGTPAPFRPVTRPSQAGPPSETIEPWPSGPEQQPPRSGPPASPDR